MLKLAVYMNCSIECTENNIINFLLFSFYFSHSVSVASPVVILNMASEIHDEIFELIEELNNAKTYSNYEFMKNLTRLNKISQEREMRSEVCQHLNTLNFAGE